MNIQENSSLVDNESAEEKKLDIVSKQKLLEAGTYFGHKTNLWNPKMKPFIHSKKMKTHIIDIAQTKKALEYAYKLIEKYAQKGASFIFVGTKKQAKDVVKEQALRTNSAYVSERWLGGTLTNNRTIMNQVRTLSDLEKLAENNYEGYTKKEGVEFSKKLEKLQRNLSGIRNMRHLPQVMIVADVNVDTIAVQEARKKNIKIIGILDTNSDPSLVDFGIPANDDSVKSINLIITILADAIVSAKNGKQLFAYQNDEAIVFPASNNEVREERQNYRKPFVKGRFPNNRNNYENNSEERKPYSRNFNNKESENK